MAKQAPYKCTNEYEYLEYIEYIEFFLKFS